MITFLTLQAWWGNKGWQGIEKLLSPLLAVPHVAFAIGFSLLFTPSGWFFRLFAFITGQEQPYNWSIVQDNLGIGLTLALALKETPFLLLMSISVLRQIQVDKLLTVSRSLGYNRSAAWVKVILPIWLRKMRFPVYAVLAYSLSVVDVAMILGPSSPPTFAVLVWQWFNDPDLSLLPRAAVGAMMLFGLCLLILAIYRKIETIFLDRIQGWQFSGSKQLSLPGKNIFRLVSLISLATLPILLVWSFALRWSFPDLWPLRFSLRFWQQEMSHLSELIGNSLLLALIAATTAIMLSVACLEYRDRYHKSIPRLVIATPMLIPQLSVLFGIQISIYVLPGAWHVPATIWAHILFAFPYVYLALDGPWQSYDQRLTQTAISLGKNRWQAWWLVKFPLLIPAILLAWAVGASVSLAQYLPTQLLGAGRIMTLTTEAVSLASGEDRRVSALYGLLQAMLPFLFFAFALATSRLADPKRQKSRLTTLKASIYDFVGKKPDYKH
nr:thiamine ABC transporter permease [Veronia nyctiphanis]